MKIFILGTAGILLNKTSAEMSHIHSSTKTHLTHNFVAFSFFKKKKACGPHEFKCRCFSKFCLCFLELFKVVIQLLTLSLKPECETHFWRAPHWVMWLSLLFWTLGSEWVAFALSTATSPSSPPSTSSLPPPPLPALLDIHLKVWLFYTSEIHVLVLFVVFRNRVFLCSPGWPRTFFSVGGMEALVLTEHHWGKQEC